MTFLSTTPREQRQAQQIQALTPSDPKGLEPGFFEGTFSGAGTGIGRAGAVANQLLGEAQYGLGSAFITKPIDALFGTETTRWLDENMRQAPRRLTASMTPDPYTTGFAGNLLYSLFGVGIPAIGGSILGGPAGGAVAAGGFQFAGTFTDLTQQGVDENTAAGVAGVDAALTGLGVAAPAAIGNRVALNTFLFGPGVNVAQDLIAGQTMGAVLEARGYTELAERYQTIHAEMIAADILLGGAFGYQAARANARATAPRATSADADITMTTAAVKHIELDTAPGIPANVAALQSHTRNLQAATESLLDGRPVRTDPTDGAFVPKPRNPAYSDNVLVDAFRDSGLPELMDEVAALEAEVAKRGVLVDDSPLPDLPANMARIEQGGGRVGRATDVKIGESYAEARWAVMEADEVAPAVKVSENQLRDRTRAASELQVNEIAAKLDPRLLLVDAPMMDVGSPTLTADGKIIAGNGRALAIQKAYAGERGTVYRDALVEAAGRFGLDAAEIQGMRAPVLVRVLQQGVDVERAAILSNEGGAMRMSGLEQARVDAGRLPSLAGVDIPDSGDFTAASMRDYLRSWVQQFPASQRAALVDAEGRLSQEGMTRLRNAVLFRAYGDSAVLQRLVESADPGARNVANALVKAGPKVVEVKDEIAAGNLHPLDISDAIVRTADLVEQIRDQGLTVDQWIAQLDMFNPGETPATLALLRFIDANKRSAKAIAEVLNGYYDSVIAAGNPNQGDMLGGVTPDPTTLLSNAIARAAPDKAADIVQDTLFRPTKAEEPVRAEAAIRGAEAQVGPWGMPAPARALADGDPLLQPRETDMSPERIAMREKLVEQRFAGKQPAARLAYTETDEFKAWADGGVVTGKDGKPLVLFHGTPETSFTEFDPDMAGFGDFGTGFYFTDARKAAEGYAKKSWSGRAGEESDGGRVIEAYLRMRNPATNAVLESAEFRALMEDDIGMDPDIVRDFLEERGYDGIAFTHKGGEVEYVAFDPDQIRMVPANAPTGKPVAIVLGGGGASGKGTIKKLLHAAGVFDEQFVDLDPDSFKTGDKKAGWEGLPEYWQIVEKGDSRAAAVVHEESSMLYKQALAKALDGGYNVVLDRTLGDPVKGLAELQRLKDAGYEVRLVGVTVDPASAVKRAVLRAQGPEKRFVPIDALLKAHKGFAQAWEQYAALADSAVLYDNEVPKGTKPKPLSGRAAGEGLQVLDGKVYDGFVRKGTLNEKATDEASLYGAAEVGSDGRVDAGAGQEGAAGSGGRGGSPVRGQQGAGDLPGVGVDPLPVLADRPDLTVITEAGTPAYAADTLAAADVAVARAETDALGFDAAVACFLRSAA